MWLDLVHSSNHNICSWIPLKTQNRAEETISKLKEVLLLTLGYHKLLDIERTNVMVIQARCYESKWFVNHHLVAPQTGWYLLYLWHVFRRRINVHPRWMKEILSTDIGPGSYECNESFTRKRNTINTFNLKNNISGWKREYEVQRNATIPNLFSRNLKLSKDAQVNVIYFKRFDKIDVDNGVMWWFLDMNTFFDKMLAWLLLNFFVVHYFLSNKSTQQIFL